MDNHKIFLTRKGRRVHGHTVLPAGRQAALVSKAGRWGTGHSSARSSGKQARLARFLPATDWYLITYRSELYARSDQ